ncbi:MAG: DNA polymerase/3'-5' exonuclease PolX [Ferroplasma sp.]
MANQELSEIFMEMSLYETIENTPNASFKSNAYRKISGILTSLPEDVSEIYRKGGIKSLMDIPGVGKAIADKIEEYLKTGKITKYEEYRLKYPIDFKNLTKIEGIGPKTALELYRSLGVKNVSDLKDALAQHKIMNLAGFGKKSEEELDKGIAQFDSMGGRLLLSDGMEAAEEIIKNLRATGLADKIEVAGSIRRMKDTIGDVDILATSTNPSKLMDAFTSLNIATGVVVKGISKTTIYLKIETTCDLRVVEPGSFGSALQYFTGSKDHNVEVRKIAMDRGYKLNEYGLYKNNSIISENDEKSIYEALGMDLIPPEMRENRGEIELAIQHKLPNLIDYSSIQGDLHTHTVESDGINTIEEMVDSAKKYGLKYIATTNHTKSLKVAHGMDEKGFENYFSKVDRLNSMNKDFRILKGAEVDILNDGSLDLQKSTLQQMDCVVASVHSGFNMDRNAMTERIIKALESGMVNILGHPTGRIINERAPYDVDLDRIAKAAEENNVFLEINSQPERLDLKDTDILLTSKYKVKYAINSDAHNVNSFRYLKYGIGTARRGWLPESRVVNTLSLDKLLKELKK